MELSFSYLLKLRGSVSLVGQTDDRVAPLVGAETGPGPGCIWVGPGCGSVASPDVRDAGPVRRLPFTGVCWLELEEEEIC